MQTKSLNGKRYILTFIDDFSKYTTIYFLSEKSETIYKLKEYVNLMNNKFGKKPKVIRSDRGGEYIGKEMIKYYKNEGIEMQFTSPYTPQQNGSAERKNRTLIEMARCMLTDAGLGNCFWAEAVNTANYIQNRVLTRARKGTPYELWIGRKPSIHHMKLFGSKCYVHIPQQKRRKLDNTAEAMLLLGYDENSKAYRCFNPNNKKFVISRDVKFLNIQANQNKELITSDEDSIIIDTRAKLMNKRFPEQNENSLNLEPVGLEDNLEQGNLEENLEGNLEENLEVNLEENLEGNLEENLEVNLEENIERRYPVRSTRGIPPEKFSVCTVTEPKTFAQALSSEQKSQWIEAMKDEIQSLAENQTWELCVLPEGRTAIGSKWVYKAKTDVKGKICRYKARLVAQGFSQKFGVDYDQVFSPVVRQTTLRILLSIASKEQLRIHHLDVKTAFLNGKLRETIYMKQPPGFENKEKPKQVCQLKRSLYGLKQAARAWNEEINDILVKYNFIQSKADTCLYSKLTTDGWIFLLIYVDDIVVATKTQKLINEVIVEINKRVKVNDLGEINHYLGMEITKDESNSYCLCQSTYIKQLVDLFGLTQAKPSQVPINVNYGKAEVSDDTLLLSNEKYQQLLGSLLYIALNTRPDISAAISILSQKTCHPHQEDWDELKRVLKYLKGTADMKLILNNKQGNQCFYGYADANWAENNRDRKSNSGYVFIFNGGLISWMCRKQNCVALSSTEAEFIALSEACQEAIWIRRVLDDMQQDIKSPTVIFEDNQSCLKLITNEKLSNRTKHIDTKIHFVKDHIDAGTVTCEYCPTEIMVADLMTKPLAASRFEKLRLECGLNY